MFGCTVKGSLVSDPSGVSICTAPVEAPDGTVVVTCPSSTTVKVAATPANDTAVVPDRPVPVMVTVAPTGPFVVERDARELRVGRKGDRGDERRNHDAGGGDHLEARSHSAMLGV